MSVKRPLVRYHGGKWKLAPWIIAHMPPHRVYVEPYGGGGSVLLRKPRSYAEVYNDLDDEIVNLFRVTRDRGGELLRALELTPFSRTDYLEAWHHTDDMLEQARRTVVRAFMGFGSAAVTMRRAGKAAVRGGLAQTGFRANSNRSGTTPAHDWKNYPSALPALIERLQGVVIENRKAAEVMAAHDSDDALHYVDPPYVAATRDAGSDYRFELTDADHVALAQTLHSLRGTVILSGYSCALYDDLYSDWQRIDRRALADGAAPRTESLWISRAISRDLFGAATNGQ